MKEGEQADRLKWAKPASRGSAACSRLCLEAAHMAGQAVLEVRDGGVGVLLLADQLEQLRHQAACAV